MSPMFETDPKLLKSKKNQVETEVNKPRNKSAAEPMQHLQQTVGNQVVQRLIAQRSGEGGFELDDEIQRRIQAERSGGEPLDSNLQISLGEKFQEDFSGVRVHAGSEADSLNRELGARAFTTGKDIFFRSGAYDPHSEGGQRLIAHELTHVLQQEGSAAEGNAPFRVNPPGDVFEQEAESLADQALSSRALTPAAGLQRQDEEEEEEELVQRQEEEEEEELVQLQVEEEEEQPDLTGRMVEETEREETPEEEAEKATEMIDEEEHLLLKRR